MPTNTDRAVLLENYNAAFTAALAADEAVPEESEHTLNQLWARYHAALDALRAYDGHLTF